MYSALAEAIDHAHKWQLWGVIVPLWILAGERLLRLINWIKIFLEGTEE